MIECGGVWLPDGERHMNEWMIKRNEVDAQGRLTYQGHKLKKALELTPGRGCVVDVGAHVGTWSMQLAQHFETVHAFEPVLEHGECLMRNCAGLSNVQVHAHALGSRDHWVTMHKTPGSSGDTYPEPGREGNTRVLRYDDLNIGAHVDLVKLDCEGFELFALMGMAQTLERCRPTVCVEQKPGKAVTFGLGHTDAVTYLESLGAKRITEMAGDYFLAW